MGFRGEAFAFGSPAEAIAAMSKLVARVGTEACSPAEACGRVLAEGARADRDSPPFDYSAMDGFAVRVADLGRGELRILGEARIGQAPPPVSAGAVRIVTGAAIPAGADAVVRHEDVQEADGAIRILRQVKAGDNIRRQGENARAGDEVLGAGREITAAGLGTLAAVGVVQPTVFRRVRVAIITTGDELVAPGGVPREFEIRNSNGPAVEGVLGGRAWIEARGYRHVRDEAESLAEAVRNELEGCDAVVLTGGVSMGHRDPVRGAVERAGGRIVFHGLPQRPGKPMLGALADGKPIFGLPGNPVSALVTCRRIVLPVLAACAGIATMRVPRVRLANPDGKTLNLWWHRLASLNDRGEAELAVWKGSGDIVGAGRAEGFLEVPPGEGEGEFEFFAW